MAVIAFNGMCNIWPNTTPFPQQIAVRCCNLSKVLKYQNCLPGDAILPPNSWGDWWENKIAGQRMRKEMLRLPCWQWNSRKDRLVSIWQKQCAQVLSMKANYLLIENSVMLATDHLVSIDFLQISCCHPQWLLFFVFFVYQLICSSLVEAIW